MAIEYNVRYLEIPFFSVFSDVNFITIRIQFRHSLDEFTY